MIIVCCYALVLNSYDTYMHGSGVGISNVISTNVTDNGNKWQCFKVTLTNLKCYFYSTNPI